jgi:hypothetical protein
MGEAKSAEEEAADSQNDHPIPKRKVNCRNCNTSNDEEGKYCTHCGLLISDLKECPDCHASIDFVGRYCPRCGRTLRPVKIDGSSVRPLAALIFGIIPGMFSIWGVGHFFAGSANKGFLFFCMGLFMAIVAPVTIFLFSNNIGDLIFWAIIGAIVWVILWLYQSVDAYWEAGGV